ncbi:hypothetical protein GWI33_015518 [Rhynchophorus ferrugineus]|uniref:Uncharacterized protein n=1 Tax=Rhynchophorus ferrugineus TaxID=354439 RepID=A0A834HZ33_RHYFE|nr:hypothetical protein GWI33_015518 [Rhynchophorus ferrugineus]
MVPRRSISRNSSKSMKMIHSWVYRSEDGSNPRTDKRINNTWEIFRLGCSISQTNTNCRKNLWLSGQANDYLHRSPYL